MAEWGGGRGTSGLVHWLWIAISALLLGLAGSVALVHVAAERVGALNLTIVGNTGPSVVALQSASADLGKLRNSLREHLETPGDDPSRASRIAGQRGALAHDTTWYFSLPIDPGEGEVIAALMGGLAHLDDVMHRVLATTTDTPRPVRAAMEGEVDAATSAVETDLLRASQINAEIAYRTTLMLESVEQRILPAAAVFQAASVIAAALAIAVAHRVSRSEAALAERDMLERKNAELEAFSARVAHDLMSPLMTVSLAVGIAEQRIALDDERTQAMLSRAGGALVRVRQTVTDLLEFARAAARPPAAVVTEVAPLLQAVVGDLQPLASEAGVALTIACASERRVRCAPGILSSIVSNLVQNAIRYTREEPVRQVDVRVVDQGAEVCFEVEDTGPGVRPEDREQIFEPYVRRSEVGGGLGLGLATVKRLAECHGGHVGVRPAEKHGALFWVTLPTAAS